MRFILVRHGETDRNRDQHHPHQGPVSINATGRKQAEAVAQSLKDTPIDVIICSNLLRAQETADIIAPYHPQAKRVVDENIRERDSGIYATKTVAEKEAAEKASGLGFRDWKPEGGESLREVKSRAEAWYEKLLTQQENISTLVVSHGLFLYTLLEVVVEGGADVEREDFSMSNGGLSMLEIHPTGRVKVVHLNNTSHLGNISTLPSGIKSKIFSNRKYV